MIAMTGPVGSMPWANRLPQRANPIRTDINHIKNQILRTRGRRWRMKLLKRFCPPTYEDRIRGKAVCLSETESKVMSGHFRVCANTVRSLLCSSRNSPLICAAKLRMKSFRSSVARFRNSRKRPASRALYEAARGMASTCALKAPQAGCGFEVKRVNRLVDH